jgi:hypothetical protein
MPITFPLDIAAILDAVDLETSIAEELEPYGGSVRCVDPHGPGGGNPVYEFTFPNREQAIAYIKNVYDPNTDDEEAACWIGEGKVAA